MKTLNRKKTQDKGLYLVLSSTLLEDFDKVALQKGTNRSELIRHLMHKAIEESK